MANDIKTTTQNVVKLQKAFDAQHITLGLVEKAGIKFHKWMVNLPVIKQVAQFGALSKGLVAAHKAVGNQTEATEENTEAQENNASVLQMLAATATQYGLAAKVARKATGGWTGALMGLASTAMFFFGILLVVAIGVAAFAAVFADVNSPMVQLMADIPVLAELLNGMRIILTGEDGESGLKGGFDVMITALVAAGAALLLFGAPIAILVGTLVGAMGIFNWVKAKTGSWVAAILAAGAILWAGLTVVFSMITGATLAASAAIVGPLLLLVAGITGMWKSLTGEISYWWGVISAIGTTIAVAILYAVAFGAAAISLPVVLLAAAAAAIVFTIVYYWDEIKAAFKAAWTWADNFFKDARAGIMGFFSGIGTWFSEKWTAFTTFVTGIPTTISDAGTAAWNSINKTKDKIINGIKNFFSPVVQMGINFWNKITGAIDKIKEFPSKIKPTISTVMNTIAAFWDEHIAGKLVPGVVKAPDWVPGLGGKEFGPFPKKASEYPGFAKGGIARGPMSGYPAMLHGTEAVVPLSGGRNIPVEMKGGGGNTFNINIDASGIIATSDRDKERFANELSEILMRKLNREFGGRMGGSPFSSMGGWG
jgi:hypothetical protein